MAFDLGLHESCSGLIAAGKMTPNEGHLRHVLFLGSCVYDKLWALYLGRPSAIPSSYLAGAQHRSNEQGWQVAVTLSAWVGLSAKISEVTDILNDDAPLNLHAIDRLTALDDQISAQCAALPQYLVLNEDQISNLPANAYGLHIQFRGIRIVLHRLLSRALSQNDCDAPLDHATQTERSQTLMRENAICIARLVSVYRQIFGIENFITVMLDNMFIAAALLVSFVLRPKQHTSVPVASTDVTMSQEVHWIRCLAEMLQHAQKHYPVTARMRSTLSALVDGTFLAGAFGVWTGHSMVSQNASHLDQPGPAAPFSDSFIGNAVVEQQDLFFSNPFSDAQGPLLQDMDTMNMSWMLSP